MRGDWVKGTAAGGSGNLTIAALAPYTAWTEWFGTSATPVPCEYVIDDGTGNYERGYGMWTGSTTTLVRAQVVATRTSAGVIGNGTPLTFSGTVGVSVSPSTGSYPEVVPGVYLPGNNQNGEWLTSGFAQATGTQSFGGSTSTGSGSQGDLFVPFLWLGGRPITKAGIWVTTATATGNTARLGLYACNVDGARKDATGAAGNAPGQPGALIAEFTSSTQINTTSTGFKYVSLNTPIYLPPGWYWAVMCASVQTTVASLNSNTQRQGMLGCISSAQSVAVNRIWNDRAYGAFPSIATLGQYNQPNYPSSGNSGNSSAPALFLSM